MGRAAEGQPVTQNLARIVEQCTNGCPVNGDIPGLNYRSQTTIGTSDAQNLNETYTWRASGSFVTGAHSLKVGYIGTHLVAGTNSFRGPADLSYRVNNGVPNQLTEYITHFVTEPHTRDDAFFGQEQWTHKRLTLQGALRFDHSWSYSAPVQEGPTRFLPTPLYLSPDAGRGRLLGHLAADGGDLRCARQRQDRVEAELRPLPRVDDHRIEFWAANPDLAHRRVERVAVVDRRQRQLHAGLRPVEPERSGPPASGGDFCAAIGNVNFGKAVFNNTIDPALLSGWGVRPSDWNFGVSVQHELLERVSVEVGYTRRWYNGFIVTDKLAVTPATSASSASRRPSIRGWAPAVARASPASMTSTPRCSASRTTT